MKSKLLILIIFLLSNVFTHDINLNVKINNNANNEDFGISNEDDDFLLDIPFEKNEFHKYEFLVEVKIGTPEQKLNVLIDTGSIDLWVFDHYGKAKTDSHVKKFNKYTSTSFKNLYKRHNITYGTGFTDGTYAVEKINFHGMPSSIDLRFLLADDSDVKTYDGILGLGYFRSEHVIEKYKEADLIHNLYENKKIPYSFFTFHLNKDRKGVLGVGDYSEDLKNTIKRIGNTDFIYSCNIPSYEHHWACDLKNFYMEGEENLELSYETIIFDTGATTNFLGFNLFKDLYFRYFKKYEKTKECNTLFRNNIFSAICDESVMKKSKDIVIQVGKNFIILKPEEYFTHLYDKSYRLIFSTIVDSYSSTFGMNLLERFFVIFDKEKRTISWALNPDYLPNNQKNNLKIRPKVIREYIKPSKVLKDASDAPEDKPISTEKPNPNPIPKPIPKPIENPKTTENPKKETLFVRNSNGLIQYSELPYIKTFISNRENKFLNKYLIRYYFETYENEYNKYVNKEISNSSYLLHVQKSLIEYLGKENVEVYFLSF